MGCVVDVRYRGLFGVQTTFGVAQKTTAAAICSMVQLDITTNFGICADIIKKSYASTRASNIQDDNPSPSKHSVGHFLLGGHFPIQIPLLNILDCDQYYLRKKPMNL